MAKADHIEVNLPARFAESRRAGKAGDPAIEETLRPRRLVQFIGQGRVKDSLKVFIEAAKKRSEPLAHVLVHGGPGLGKTTLATIIARELGASIRVTSGPAIERTGDLAALLTNLQPGDVLFIDEIHRLPRVIEEVLYPAMEDFALDIVIGKGPSAKTLRLDLPRFTLVGATTRIGSLSSPLRDRFGVVYQLDFYSEDDIAKIIRRSAQILKVVIDEPAVQAIAKRSRATPRVANRLLARVRDVAQVRGQGQITPTITQEALKLLEIDELGLDPTDRRILLTIAQKFNGGPVGVNTIAAACGQQRQTIEDVIEPYLMQLGFLDRTAKGRRVTQLALEHLRLSAKAML